MKRVFAAFLAALLALTASPALAAYWDVPETAWYAQAVDHVTQAGYMNGEGGGCFDPGSNMSRGMLAAVLHRLAGSPHSYAGLFFEDVETGTWYIDSVIWCAEHGIVTGIDEAHFCPDAPVTREQVALMLWRQAGWPKATGAKSFADSGQINFWSVGGVDWASGAGILTGKPGNRFDPQGTATRAEVAQMLMKYDQWRKK